MGGAASKQTEITYKKPKLASLETALSSVQGPIQVNGITLNSPKQLHKIISIVIALGNLSEPLLANLDAFKGENPYLDAILDLGKDGSVGPLEIQKQVTKILTQLVNQEGNLSQFDSICAALTGILPVLAPIFADWVGIFLGQENVEEVLKELVELGAHQSFDLVKSFYYSLPQEVQKMMGSRENIGKFLNSTLTKSRQIIKKLSGLEEVEGPDVPTQAVETVYTYLGQILLSKVIEEQFRPAIKPASKVIAKVLPLTFAVLAINQFCTQKGKLEELGPISTALPEEIEGELVEGELVEGELLEEEVVREEAEAEAEPVEVPVEVEAEGEVFEEEPLTEGEEVVAEEVVGEVEGEAY